jgi:hypothetical protein
VVHGDNKLIPFIRAAKDGQQVIMLDLADAFLHAPNRQEKVHTRLPEGWGDLSGKWVILKKAVFGLLSAAHEFGEYIAKQMRSLGFKACEMDRNVWLREEKDTGLYTTITLYVDDGIAAVSDPEALMKELETVFHIKFWERMQDGSDKEQRYLGGDLGRAGPFNVITATTFIKELLANFERKNALPAKRKTPLPPGAHPEEDVSPVLDAKGKQRYQKLIGVFT